MPVAAFHSMTMTGSAAVPVLHSTCCSINALNPRTRQHRYGGHQNHWEPSRAQHLPWPHPANTSSQRGHQQKRPVRCRAQQQQPDAQAAMGQFNSIMAELRADPELAPLLTDDQLVAAVREVAANPAALSQHASNPKVMAVLTRLASLNISRQQSAAFEAAGTSPEALVRQMAASSELSALLSKPSVRQALTRIRTAADPDAEVQAAQADPDVKRALDLLEAAVMGDTGDVVLDV